MNTATQALMFSSGKDDWGTPPEFFAELDHEFSFCCDAAANADNHLTPVWFGPGSSAPDALAIRWRAFTNGPCYCNPPYSRGLQARFIRKALESTGDYITTVMLLPARTDTRVFHECIWDVRHHTPRPDVEVRFLKGRLKFGGAKDSAPFPSMVVIFRG